MTGATREGGSEREIESGEGRFRVRVAWRRDGGPGLLYFVPLAGDDPDPDDGRDRRAVLESGRSLEELSDEELAAKLDEGTGLTGTERRIRAPDGRLWLAQSVGPVWADEDPAEGSTGLLFTALEGPERRLRGPGAHAGELSREELADLWRRAAPDEETGSEAGEAEPREEGGAGAASGGT